MNDAKQKQTIAVIDIGASAIRMIVAEIGKKADVKHLERLQKPVRFGHDVFSDGRISRAAMNEGISILSNFKEVCNGYGVQRIQAVATSALRAAANRDNFIDRAYVRTGIDVEIIEGPEESRLELIAVESSLAGKIDLSKINCLIVEVGSGSTDMMILNQGQVEVTRTLSIGSMRLPSQAESLKNEPEKMQRALKRAVREIASDLAQEYNLKQLNAFIAIGADMRFVSKQIAEGHDEQFAILEKKDFVNFVSKISKKTPDEIVQKYGIPYAQAETLYPSLIYYYSYFQETDTDRIIVPMASIRDGILIEFAQIVSGYRRTDVSKQVMSSARHLGEKYRYDKKHAERVSQSALKLFDELKSEHGMGGRERLLLEISAILHDIGYYVSPNSHHRHSAYLIKASDIFGIRKSDREIVANAVRYHRRSLPKPSHVDYMSLAKRDRASVSKLAAILRVADALDRGHQQNITQFEVEKSDKAVTLWVPKTTGDISVERSVLEDKGRFFADVFGLPIILRKKVLEV